MVFLVHSLNRNVFDVKSIKERQATTDSMFEPLGEILDMMRHYGVVIPEETLVQFQELPEKWANTKRLTVISMQQVAPLQTLEVIKLKKKTINVDKAQNEFRRTFLRTKFFKTKCTQPYEYLGYAHTMIAELEKDITVHNVSLKIRNG